MNPPHHHHHDLMGIQSIQPKHTTNQPKSFACDILNLPSLKCEPSELETNFSFSHINASCKLISYQMKSNLVQL